ncbi:uncharacterized protein FIESC28_03772 [Fusarium coffeatum]|uniref:N-acetyltransferase domain-containing protein n=1 Tax=Fusarium coffeatum TaxID=231269 RepID=A0A366S236_9HYPO|nr:uncharacterized protein FIESC28_03772 [Fusarium coffeatum]RBR23393.1 hypothetical protein FIESC28_03772 [Fusarium coffeatum]
MSSSDTRHSCDPNLGLVHPTAEERVKIWKGTSSAWEDSIPVHAFLQESEDLATRAIENDYDGNVKDAVVHGIASVSCPEEYRRRAYDSRYFREMHKVLREWESEEGVTVGSILYSDIGSKWMSVLRWLPDPKQSQLVFPSVNGVKPTSV